MPTEVITKPCAQCGTPILQTRNNKSTWASVIYCDNKCKRIANRHAEWEDLPPEPTRIEVPNPHVNWRPTKGKKNKV
jgi:hypothetical protein